MLARSDERILTAAWEPADVASLLRDVTANTPEHDVDVRLR
jgi:hypothetical protein